MPSSVEQNGVLVEAEPERLHRTLTVPAAAGTAASFTAAAPSTPFSCFRPTAREVAKLGVMEAIVGDRKRR